MADHDRDAGSRGEEEAPRDPAREEPAAPSTERDTDVYPDQSNLKYGEIPPGPGPHVGQDYTSAAHTLPGSDSSYRRADTSFRDFIRQKPAQIAGAGLIGLVLGAMIGGTTVAVVSNLGDRHERHGVYVEYPDWRPKRFVVPDQLNELCQDTGDDIVCEAPFDMRVRPNTEPTSTG
ncbi:hypothetical protein ETD86_09430 [Nonomuraea turkmeniaca]|uniref:Uncharacterized protein n=1 Tax=Nonomuraea turkmeniaca TaxID=103838 RepID=A0A5S4FR67_9ACTN|nr:hypothetical protein [Nonomuraea turkmeniaca]TMR23118.1 hypothetical protein ETD86_09430 [Nonomuraea turkmeniaca]